MNSRLHLQLRYVRLISLLVLPGALVTTLTQAACYKTPRTAIDALQTNSSVSFTSETSGYRVTRLQSDPVLGQRWAMIANCGHPEWPVFALPAGEVSSLEKTQETKHPLIESAKASPVVRVGDLVRLWKQESLLRIEVAGVSEESGSVGKTIRVRLLHSNTDGQSAPEEFSGVVRGPSDVEIQP
jgi:hypothetical protein